MSSENISPQILGNPARTTEVVAEQLEQVGWDVSRLPGSGLVADLGEEGPAVALRADMDALPVDDVAYALLPAPAPLRVGLVTPGNLFLEAALLLDDNVEVVVGDVTRIEDVLAAIRQDLPEAIGIIARLPAAERTAGLAAQLAGSVTRTVGIPGPGRGIAIEP